LSNNSIGYLTVCATVIYVNGKYEYFQYMWYKIIIIIIIIIIIMFNTQYVKYHI